MSNEPLSYVPDLSGVDTSRPVPIPGTYIAQLTNCELVFSQGDQSKPMFKLTLALQQDATAYGGKGNISPGFTLTENVLLYQAEQKPGKNPPPDYKVQLCKWADALGGFTDDTRPGNAGNLPQFIGRKVAITTKVDESDEFGLQCRITKKATAPAGA